MHILLEEAPLLVYYFLTLFLSNYKLRLILSIFWTTSTFCQLELPCSLRSLTALAHRSLTSFVRSTLASLTHFVRSLRSLIARFTHSLRSFAQRSLASHSSIRLVLRPASLHFASLYTTLGRELSFGIPILMFTHFFKFVQSLVPSLFQIRLCNRFVPKNFSIKL